MIKRVRVGRKKGTHCGCSNGAKMGFWKSYKSLNICTRMDESECSFIHLLRCSRRRKEKDEWKNTIKERERRKKKDHRKEGKNEIKKEIRRKKITEKEKNEIRISLSYLFSLFSTSFLLNALTYTNWWATGLFECCFLVNFFSCQGSWQMILQHDNTCCFQQSSL